MQLIRFEDGEAALRDVALNNEGVEEGGGVLVDLESLDLEDNLNDAVENGEGEVEDSDFGESDAIRLGKGY